MNTNGVTRFEMIDHRAEGQGRILALYGIKVEVDFQDDGRTMKVFIHDGQPFVMDPRGWNDRQS